MEHRNDGAHESVGSPSGSIERVVEDLDNLAQLYELQDKAGMRSVARVNASIINKQVTHWENRVKERLETNRIGSTTEGQYTLAEVDIVVKQLVHENKKAFINFGIEEGGGLAPVIRLLTTKYEDTKRVTDDLLISEGVYGKGITLKDVWDSTTSHNDGDAPPNAVHSYIWSKKPIKYKAVGKLHMAGLSVPDDGSLAYEAIPHDSMFAVYLHIKPEAIADTLYVRMNKSQHRKNSFIREMGTDPKPAADEFLKSTNRERAEKIAESLREKGKQRFGPMWSECDGILSNGRRIHLQASVDTLAIDILPTNKIPLNTYVRYDLAARTYDTYKVSKTDGKLVVFYQKHDKIMSPIKLSSREISNRVSEIFKQADLITSALPERKPQ